MGGDCRRARLVSFNTQQRSKKRQNAVIAASAIDKVENANALTAMQASRAHNRLCTFKVLKRARVCLLIEKRVSLCERCPSRVL